MNSKLKQLTNKLKEQEEQIKIISKQFERQKWMSVYLLWSR